MHKGFARRIGRVLPWVFLCLMAALTLYLDVFCARGVLDGDTSEYMVRAWEMRTQNRLIPADYAFTSEMRLLDMPLLYSLLFRLTDNWTSVRVLGTVIAQALYLLGVRYLLKIAGAERPWRVTGMALCLMPFSTAYARIMLYHAHYALYMAQACLMLGLSLKLARPKGGRGRTAVRAVLLGLCWFACGLNGVRHLMLLALPMGLCALVLLMRPLRRTAPLRRDEITGGFAFRFTGALLLGLCCFLPGLLINTRVITPGLDVQAQSATAFCGSVAEGKALTLLNNLLHAMGVRVTNASLLGVRGLSLGCALLLFGGLWALCFTRKASAVPQPNDEEAEVLHLLPPCALLGTAALLLLADGHEPEEWYFIPPLAFALPVLALALRESVHPRENTTLLRRAGAVLLALCLCFQGGYTALFIRSMGRSRLDTWTGLPLHTMNVTEELQPIADTLLANGEDRCLTLYWYASPLTEMTDGRVRAAAYFREGDCPLLTLHGYGTDLRPYRQGDLPETVAVMLAPQDAGRLTEQYPSAQYEYTCGAFEMWRVRTEEIDLTMTAR